MSPAEVCIPGLKVIIVDAGQTGTVFLPDGSPATILGCKDGFEVIESPTHPELVKLWQSVMTVGFQLSQQGWIKPIFDGWARLDDDKT